MKNLTRILTAIFLAALFGATAQASHESADVIFAWNQLAQRNIGGQPFSQTRQYAILQVAMADAVLSIDASFKPFRVRTWAPRGASEVAAAAQAARDVLVAFFPANQATFDAELATQLASIPPGRRFSGVEVGKKVAAAVLAWRQNDGFALANPQPPAFLASTLPGIWRATASGPAQFSELGSVAPFGVLTPTQFLPAAPPQLESAEYAEDFNEVKSKGRATLSTRTAEETRFAQLFAGVGGFANVTNPFRLWQNVARDVALAKNLSLAQTARLFALLTTSIHDSLQTAHTSKFVYRLWRPQTAVDQAGVDNNAATDPELLWPPLLTTPPYASHSSNMACIGAGAARMLANVLGTDNVPFTATWYTGASPPIVVHAQPYSGFWAMAEDEGNSRIWGGIHFRFEITASQVSCLQVADFIFKHRMQRAHGR